MEEKQIDVNELEKLLKEDKLPLSILEEFSDNEGE